MATPEEEGGRKCRAVDGEQLGRRPPSMQSSERQKE